MRLASLMSSDTVSRTASRRVVSALASASRRTSSGTTAATSPEAEATTGAEAATTGAAATGAAAAATGAAAFLEAFAALGASATGATGATTASSAFFVTTRFTAVFAEAAAELIIPEAEVEVEDILRRTSCYTSHCNHFL